MFLPVEAIALCLVHSLLFLLPGSFSNEVNCRIFSDTNCQNEITSVSTEGTGGCGWQQNIRNDRHRYGFRAVQDYLLVILY